jgi:parallel beta-helix repeat protein
LGGALLAAALTPVPSDPPVDMANHGAGSSSVVPAYSGLLREFPPLNEPGDNATTPEKAELGRMLFFDPALSQNDDMSCATCHHPDLGFSDGRPTAAGAGGVALARNAPGLWNVGYAGNLFWDGRETSLEAQAMFPLTHADEMGVENTDDLVAELQANPEYVQLFEQAFGAGEPINQENIGRALAAFERTLISDDSPFDRYAAGDYDALTAQQRRGLAVFRSGATRCFECHTAPTFASDTFRVIGVPSDDPGRAGVVADGLQGAFKVPSLRNVALTAPYMHDGSMETLEEVVDFYSKGGGRAHGAEQVDVFVNAFDLTDQERADLIAFLHALTDESRLPAIPAAVPSGLPVVGAVENPARAVSAAFNTGVAAAAATAAGEPQTITVQSGETIQAAVDRARPGDTVEIPYGTYHERVVVDISDLTLRGVPNEAGEFPVLDGRGELADGVIASGNNFTVGNLRAINYTDNGFLVEGATGVHFHDLIAENTGTYGIYPVRSTDVLIERVTASGVNDAGIYAGQSENVLVRDSVAFGNVIGVELENVLNGEINGGHYYGNSNGILIVLLPQLNSKVSTNTLITGSLVEGNNHPNFAPEGATARIVPPGTGILLIGTDNAEVTGNTIKDNKTAGVAVFSLTGTGAFNENELDVGPLAEGNYVHDNTYENNGYDPDPVVSDLGIPAGDILWDTTGDNNRFDEASATSFPPLLPSDNWPGFVRAIYNNVLGTLVGLVS